MLASAQLTWLPTFHRTSSQMSLCLFHEGRTEISSTMRNTRCFTRAHKTVPVPPQDQQCNRTPQPTIPLALHPFAPLTWALCVLRALVDRGLPSPSSCSSVWRFCNFFANSCIGGPGCLASCFAGPAFNSWRGAKQIVWKQHSCGNHLPTVRPGRCAPRSESVSCTSRSSPSWSDLIKTVQKGTRKIEGRVLERKHVVKQDLKHTVNSVKTFKNLVWNLGKLQILMEGKIGERTKNKVLHFIGRKLWYRRIRVKQKSVEWKD